MRRSQKLRKKRNPKKTRGGRYFYPYNDKPLMFTNVSNKQHGGFIKNMIDRLAYNVQSSYGSSNGYYPQPYKNPDPLVQPISSNYKL